MTDRVQLTDAVIEKSRWSIRITGTDNGGQPVTLIASADSWYTQGDGIWFGTEEDYVADS